MLSWIRAQSQRPLHPIVVHLVRVAVLFLPALLLVIESARHFDPPNWMLWLGAGFQFLACCLSLCSRKGWQQPIGPSVIVLYIIALSWLWLGAADFTSWFPYLARAILLVVPLSVFAVQTLSESGAPALRRAQLLAQRLANRTDWPADLADCRTLPEVKALRAALQWDATPALALLQDKRPQVRLAALAALEFRKNWYPGQAELVLHVAQRAQEPAVRVAAVSALGNVDDPYLTEALAEFLRDPNWEVRRAATEALLWDTERRWNSIRHMIRRTLADPILQEDGALRCEGQLLTAEAVKDLNAWATEKGILAVRAALTLGIHYSRALSAQQDPELVQELQQQLANPHAPPLLRMELARILKHHGELDRGVLEKLLDHANPAPLRLLAVEAILAEGEHNGAVDALHDLARLPNREIALATADVVQRRLGIDLGLAMGQPLPPVHSRLAAEVTRRVMAWAIPQEARAPHADSHMSTVE